MTTRVTAWIAVLTVADALAWVLTIHAHATFRRAANGPSVMSVGQLLGWALSVVLLVVLVMLLVGVVRSRRR